MSEKSKVFTEIAVLAERAGILKLCKDGVMIICVPDSDRRKAAPEVKPPAQPLIFDNA